MDRLTQTAAIPQADNTSTTDSSPSAARMIVIPHTANHATASIKPARTSTICLHNLGPCARIACFSLVVGGSGEMKSSMGRKSLIRTLTGLRADRTSGREARWGRKRMEMEERTRMWERRYGEMGSLSVSCVWPWRSRRRIAYRRIVAPHCKAMRKRVWV